MNVIRRPREHSILFSAILLAIPIFMLNLWVIEKVPFAKLFQGNAIALIAIQAAWTLLSTYFLLKARRYALALVAAMSLFIVCADVYILLASKNYALAFYALFIVIISALFLIQAYRYLGSPYYISKRKWYEGSPAHIPNISAELVKKGGEDGLAAKLSNLSVEGCFCFFDSPQINASFDRIRIDLFGHSITCVVELVSKTSDNRGFGYRFRSRTADQRKELEDFIYYVRSSGYADN